MQFYILRFRTSELNIGMNLNTGSDKAKQKSMITAKIATSKWPSVVAKQWIPFGKCSFGSRTPSLQAFKSLGRSSSWWYFLVFCFLKTINGSKTHCPPKPFIIVLLLFFPLLTPSKHFKETDLAFAFHCDHLMSDGTLRKERCQECLISSDLNEGHIWGN